MIERYVALVVHHALPSDALLAKATLPLHSPYAIVSMQEPAGLKVSVILPITVSRSPSPRHQDTAPGGSCPTCALPVTASL